MGREEARGGSFRRRLIACAVFAGLVPLVGGLTARPAASNDETIAASATDSSGETSAVSAAPAKSPPRRSDPATSLRAARSAARAGDVATARELFAEVAAHHAVIADYADLLHVRLVAEHGDARDAATRAELATVRHSDSPLVSDFYQLLGAARLALGDEEGARKAWLEAIATSHSRERRPPLLLAIAQSFERTGDAKAAADHYLTIWASMPLTDEASTAESRLDVLAPGASLRTGAEWRRRADRIFRKRRNELALAAYEKALELGLSDSDTRRARRQIAQVLFRMRKYPRAVKEFAALPQEDDVPIWHARSMARAGRVREAIEEFKQFSLEVGGSLRTRSTYLAALLAEDLADGKDESRRLFGEVAKSGDKPGLGSAALWRLGWTLYREKNWAGAISYWDPLVGVGEDPIVELRVRYWRARAFEHLGDPRAAELYAEIALEYPLSYYGWRAAGRVDPKADRPVVPAPEVAQGRPVLTTEDLARPRILLQAGLEEEAMAELQRVSPRARGLHDRLQVAELYRAAGQYHAAQRLVIDAYSQLLSRAPIASLEDLWWHAWPYAYADLVVEATGHEGGVEPELVYSIMREESSYRADVISPVGARGLLQIMEETGQRLAERRGRAKISADDLFEPQINIELGAQYLSELSERFDGRLAPAIASYNAGPEAVRRWIEETPRDEDEWVEAIPYEQTRHYVKRVLRSVHAYAVLY